MALDPSHICRAAPLSALGNRKLVLGSSSARRKTLLALLDIPFEVQVKTVEERFPPKLRREAIAQYLAALKAKTFEPKAEEIVLTADTLVWHEGKALGKPRDKAQAALMLNTLSGSTHEVITAVALKSPSKMQTFYDTTKVYFKNLKTAEIDFYLKNYPPLDKAGAYGIQDWIGGIGIQKIEGSFYTVMGLPLQKLYEALHAFL